MAKRWEQITTKCLHHLNDLGPLAAITLIDSSVLAQTSRLQLCLLFLNASLHRLNKKHSENDKTKCAVGVLSFTITNVYLKSRVGLFVIEVTLCVNVNT